MGKDNVTRREAVGDLIAITLFTAAIPQIFLMQTTSAANLGRSDQSAPRVRQPELTGSSNAARGERVAVAGEGSLMVFTILGSPGRHCRVAFAAESSETYRMAPGGSGIIGQDGKLVLSVDVRQLGSKRLRFRVGTSPDAAFNRDLKGTMPFEVSIQNGVLQSLSGIGEREALAGRDAGLAVSGSASTPR